MKIRPAMSRSCSSSYLFGICLCLSLCVLGSHAFDNGCKTYDREAPHTGVGFDLTLNYGTSAVQFPNGTRVAVAKIEGSPDYKHFMRLPGKADVESAKPTLHLEEALVDPTSHGWLSGISRAISQLLQHILPGRSNKSPDAKAIEAMLLALKVSTESYLNERVCTADISTPYRISDHQRSLLDSAVATLSLRRLAGTQILAGQMASRATGFGQCPTGESCDFEGMKPQWILTVDYSRAALGMILYMEDRGVYEDFRSRHDIELGTDALMHHRDAGKVYWGQVRKAVKEITERPLPKTDSHDPNTIGQLVLLGDRVTDPKMLRVLVEVLGKPTVKEAQVRSTEAEGGIVDPVFAAAIGVATVSKRQLDEGSEVVCLI